MSDKIYMVLFTFGLCVIVCVLYLIVLLCYTLTVSL